MPRSLWARRRSCCRSDASAQRKFTFAYDQPRTTAYGIAADIFDAKLKELSGGKISRSTSSPARSSARSR